MKTKSSVSPKLYAPLPGGVFSWLPPAVFACGKLGGHENTQKDTKEYRKAATECTKVHEKYRATDNTDSHGFFAFGKKRLATKAHKRTRKNTERQATDLPLPAGRSHE